MNTEAAPYEGRMSMNELKTKGGASHENAEVHSG